MKVILFRFMGSPDSTPLLTEREESLFEDFSELI